MLGTTPARSAAVALALVCALSQQASGDIIFDAGAIPNPFSPNADGVFDSTAVYYSLSEQAAIVVTVADSIGSGIWTFWSGWEDPGEHSHWWNGWFHGDSLGADGRYTFLVKAITDGRSIDEVTIPFVQDTVPPPLEQFTVAPSRFSPDGDGVGDSLLVSFVAGITEPSDQVVVTALDSDDEPVRLIYSANGVASASTFWDGLDDDGAALEDGLYYVRGQTRDAAGNASEMGALVDLDTAPPELGADYTDSLGTEVRVETPEADVTGWAFDRAGVVAVEYSTDGENWMPATIGRPDNVTWSAAVACTACVPDSLDSTMTLHVRAYDGTPTASGQGHVNSQSSAIPPLEFDVVFDVAPPIHLSTAVGGGGGPFTAGETVTLTSQWDESGYDVTADFSQVDSEFEPADVEVSETTGNRYSISYHLSTDNSLLPVTDAPVVVTATDSFGRSVADTSTTLTVLPASGDGPSGFSVNANSFRPLEGGSVLITLGAYSGKARIEIYNMAGTLVRTHEGEGESSFTWYGENEAGETVSSGVYFMRIQIGGDEIIRKVAVIK
jgi:flagellar hook assembly protein FlgD